jgi:hypothetical protein
MNPSPLKQKPAHPIHIPGMKLTCPIPASSNTIVPSNYYFRNRLVKYLRPFILLNTSIGQDTRLRIVHCTRTVSRIHSCVNACKFPNQLSDNTLQFSTIMSHDISNADGMYSALTNFCLRYLRMADLLSLGTLLHRGKQILLKSSNHLNVLGATEVTRSKFHTQDPQILGATEHNLLARVTWSSEIFHSCLYII